MAWDPRSLIASDQPAKKDDADAMPVGDDAPLPVGTPGKRTLLLGTNVTPNESPTPVFDPTKMPHRPSLAYLPTGDDDNPSYRYRRDREPRRVKSADGLHYWSTHFDVNAEEMGVNPPSFGWFVCLSCTMFTLTLSVLLIAYYINKPSSNLTPQPTNTTIDGNATAHVSKKMEVTTVQTEPTDDDGVQNAIDVIYHE